MIAAEVGEETGLPARLDSLRGDGNAEIAPQADDRADDREAVVGASQPANLLFTFSPWIPT